jgi:ribosome-associated heat shock protein Hsp15
MDGEQQRLDKWLVYARFVRTRSVAQTLVSGGHVRINARRVNSGAARLAIGDVLTLALPHATQIVKVLAFDERRRGASQAQLLYAHVGQIDTDVAEIP